MEPLNLPKEFLQAIPTLEKLIEFSHLHNTSREALCLSYAQSISWAKGIVVGVASITQLKKLLEPRVTLPKDFDIEIPALDVEFLDPRGWPKLL